MSGFGGISLLGDRFLLRTNPDGSRDVSWRVWVLIWVTPVLFFVASLLLYLYVMWIQETYVETTGTVTHVYAWDNDAPQIFYPGQQIYSPRYRYTWSDGEETEATAGTSHTGWNFEIGSEHRIRYDPGQKGDVVLVGPSEWWVARIIAWITFYTFIPAALAAVLVTRWRARGQPAR